jgi:hypothetical protein
MNADGDGPHSSAARRDGLAPVGQRISDGDWTGRTSELVFHPSPFELGRDSQQAQRMIAVRNRDASMVATAEPGRSLGILHMVI